MRTSPSQIQLQLAVVLFCGFATVNVSAHEEAAATAPSSGSLGQDPFMAAAQQGVTDGKNAVVKAQEDIKKAQEALAKNPDDPQAKKDLEAAKAELVLAQKQLSAANETLASATARAPEVSDGQTAHSPTDTSKSSSGNKIIPPPSSPSSTGSQSDTKTATNTGTGSSTSTAATPSTSGGFNASASSGTGTGGSDPTSSVTSDLNATNSALSSGGLSGILDQTTTSTDTSSSASNSVSADFGATQNSAISTVDAEGAASIAALGHGQGSTGNGVTVNTAPATMGDEIAVFTTTSTANTQTQDFSQQVQTSLTRTLSTQTPRTGFGQ